MTNIGGIVVTAVAPVGGVNVPVNCVPRRVLRGEHVYLRPLPTNVGNLNIGLYAGEVVAGPCDVVAKGDIEREFPVKNLGQIWIAGPTAGDGITINIRKTA